MKDDYKIVNLNSIIDDLNKMLTIEHQKYSAKITVGQGWKGEDFAQLYMTNLALLGLIKRQNDMINNLYQILDRHESGLG